MISKVMLHGHQFAQRRPQLPGAPNFRAAACCLGPVRWLHETFPADCPRPLAEEFPSAEAAVPDAHRDFQKAAQAGARCTEVGERRSSYVYLDHAMLMVRPWLAAEWRDQQLL